MTTLKKEKLTYTEASIQYSKGLLTWEEFIAMKGNFKYEFKYADTCKHKSVSAHPDGTSCCDCGSDLVQDGSGEWRVID